MKKLFVALCLLLLPLSLAASPVLSYLPHKYIIRPREYRFSTYFYLEDENGTPLGHIERPHYRLTARYHHYDQENNWVASACMQLIQIGKVLDVYDKKVYFGTIEEAYITTATSKYRFYDEKGEYVAVAYMDSNRLDFVLWDAATEKKHLATFRRVFMAGVPDHWVVTVSPNCPIDVRMIGLFSAFINDYQSTFREDT